VTAVNFGLSPQQAVAFFHQKGLQDTFAWQDMLHWMHDHAFTVAKMLDLDLLSDVKGFVDRAIAEGWTRQRFIDELRPLLVKAGWWGRAEMTDPATGEISTVQLGSPRRLQIIYDTNLRTSYAAGHWERIRKNAAFMPYVMYTAVLDARTRPMHRLWDGTVLRWDDPWWDTHTPPNGWNCRCNVIQLSDRDLTRMGKSGPDAAPDDGMRDWTNPRTGEVVQVPVGIDPGWGYAPGASLADEQARTLELAREKAQAAPADLRAAFLEWLDAAIAQRRAAQ
jgi:SPP1 gp7 family putative phage head morphogenesis protein